MRINYIYMCVYATLVIVVFIFCVGVLNNCTDIFHFILHYLYYKEVRKVIKKNNLFSLDFSI